MLGLFGVAHWTDGAAEREQITSTKAPRKLNLKAVKTFNPRPMRLLPGLRRYVKEWPVTAEMRPKKSVILHTLGAGRHSQGCAEVEHCIRINSVLLHSFLGFAVGAWSC